MHIIVAGGTGFIGQALIKSLLIQQHQLTVVGRTVTKITDQFGAAVDALAWTQLANVDPNTVDAVINLSGQNIGNKRWTANVKQTIKQSRIDTTNSVVAWCESANRKIPHLYNASAIGIYGNQYSPTPITEQQTIAQNQHSFLSEVAQAWEQAATSKTVAITLLRFAPVLHRSGGMLKTILPSFQLGLGSVMGTGEQGFSWIGLTDAVAAITFLLAHPEIIGPVNICSPNPTSQRDFAKKLAQQLHRPQFLTLPAKLLQCIFGEVADELLLSGQTVYPEKLINAGFNFTQRQFANVLI